MACLNSLADQTTVAESGLSLQTTAGIPECDWNKCTHCLTQQGVHLLPCRAAATLCSNPMRPGLSRRVVTEFKYRMPPRLPAAWEVVLATVDPAERCACSVVPAAHMADPACAGALEVTPLVLASPLFAHAHLVCCHSAPLGPGPNKSLASRPEGYVCVTYRLPIMPG